MIKTSTPADTVCIAKVNEAGQDHVFADWDDLGVEEHKVLLEQLRSIDFQMLRRLTRRLLDRPAIEQVLHPVETTRLDGTCDKQDLELCRTLGDYALDHGEVALVTTAGSVGGGSADEPLGCVPIGPITGKSLFQLQAEKIRALNRRHKTSLKWMLFCHPHQVEATIQFFKDNSYFGLNCSDLHFFPHELLPLVDHRGKLLMSAVGRVAFAPTGHGAVLERLLGDEQIDAFDRAGVRYLYYFQTDNPLAVIGDTVFLGHHIKTQAEVSSKCVRREDPSERVGVFCKLNDAVRVIEYTELQDEDRRARDETGALKYTSGNIANHVFSLDFLKEFKARGCSLDFHAVATISPYLDKRGRLVRPTEPNCFKFQTYIFDALRDARRAPVVEVERSREFSPIKSNVGKFSPLSAQRDLSQCYGNWVRSAYDSAIAAGRTDLEPPELTHAVEVSPLYAMDEAEFIEKTELPLDLSGDVLLRRRSS